MTPVAFIMAGATPARSVLEAWGAAIASLDTLSSHHSIVVQVAEILLRLACSLRGLCWKLGVQAGEVLLEKRELARVNESRVFLQRIDNVLSAPQGVRRELRGHCVRLRSTRRACAVRAATQKRVG